MKMNRRAFFRFFGQASGTAAAVVVGGAALLPAFKSAESKWMGPFELPGGMEGMERLPKLLGGGRIF